MDLKQLTDISGVSGHEQAIRRALLAELKDSGIPASLDRMGNVVAVKEGTGPAPRKRVLAAAHMDEVGFIVTSVTDEGLLRFRPCGGIDPRVVISKRVRVGDAGLPGVIGAMTIHLQSREDRENVLGYPDIYIDIGAKDRAEAEEKAPAGTYVTFDTPYVLFGDGFVSAKALDDRVGCLSLLRLLKEDYPCDLIGVFTSEEEVGCRGAQGAAFANPADAGIVLEGTTCNDLGDVPDPLKVCRCGEGVAVSFMDNASIGDVGLFRRTIALAEEKKLHYHVKGSVSGGNDSRALQRARGGIPTIVLSVPCRSIHSPSSVAKLSDVDDQFALANAMLKELFTEESA